MSRIRIKRSVYGTWGTIAAGQTNSYHTGNYGYKLWFLFLFLSRISVEFHPYLTSGAYPLKRSLDASCSTCFFAYYIEYWTSLY